MLALVCACKGDAGSPRGCGVPPDIVFKWLLPCHVCCMLATVGEHLASPGAPIASRRFLATPLHEMMFHRRHWPRPQNRTGTFSRFRHLTRGAVETELRWTPRPTSKKGCRAVT